jgi:hypothetical protein
MKVTNHTPAGITAMRESLDGADLLLPLVSGHIAGAAQFSGGAVVGELVGITDDGATALVVFPGRSDSSAVRGRSVIDLHGADIGRQVVLMFEGTDLSRPIVMGVVRGPDSCPLDPSPGNVEVDADGRRMVVTAKEQLVLRCGKASITLTKAGKVLIEGTYVSSRASGVNRVKGGSVQLN